MIIPASATGIHGDLSGDLKEGQQIIVESLKRTKRSPRRAAEMF